MESWSRITSPWFSSWLFRTHPMYKKAESFDAIVTVFFLDTAPVVIEYIEAISRWVCLLQLFRWCLLRESEMHLELGKPFLPSLKSPSDAHTGEDECCASWNVAHQVFDIDIILPQLRVRATDSYLGGWWPEKQCNCPPRCSSNILTMQLLATWNANHRFTPLCLSFMWLLRIHVRGFIIGTTFCSLLKEGGFWINFGPLLYHWAQGAAGDTDERFASEYNPGLRGHLRKLICICCPCIPYSLTTFLGNYINLMLPEFDDNHSVWVWGRIQNIPRILLSIFFQNGTLHILRAVSTIDATNFRFFSFGVQGRWS